MIDTHAHLNQIDYDSDLGEVVESAYQRGIKAIICVGTTSDSSAKGVKIALQYPQVHPAVGIQPNYTAEVGDDDWNAVVELSADPNVVAIGETGLDRYWDFAPLSVQYDYFDRHLRLARQRDLPVVIHCREAEAELLEVLREAAGRGPLQGVLHSFSGSAEFAAECVKLGLFVSFSGMVTYRNRKFLPLREVVGSIPEGRLLLETDSPYLVPHPLRGRQKRNEPANLGLIAESVAELRGVSTAEIIGTTTANARRLFSLAEPG